MYFQYFKRVFDVIVAFIMILITIPVLIPIFLFIKFDSKGPVFFVQQRVGKDLQPFHVYKLRTMTNEKREVEKVIGKTKGVTKVGYVLRRFKLDELPQLLNVFKGEMSIVGPRPSIIKQLEEMNAREKKRYSVRPGMTGLAQVCGNIHISWKERYKYDLKYLNNISLMNDLKIISRTLLILIGGEKKFTNNPLRINKI